MKVTVKLRPEAEETVEHRAYKRQNTALPDDSTPIDELNTWFAQTIKKRAIREGVEHRVNMRTPRSYDKQVPIVE